MESTEYKKQYGEYLARAEEALNRACERYLPEESEVCRAARYSLMGGGKRIRAVLVLAVCDMLHGHAGGRCAADGGLRGCGRCARSGIGLRLRSTGARRRSREPGHGVWTGA